MTTRAWRRVSLRWPPNAQQWEGLQQELDAIYRQLRDIQANGVSGGSGTADLSNLDADNLTSGTVPAARMPGLTGDVTSSAGTVATTLAASGVTAGTYGDATHIPSVTVDAKGRITAASESAISSSTVTASVYRSTNQTLTHNTATAISLDTEHYDASNLWVVGTPTKFIVPTGKDGVYTFKGQIALGTGFQGVALLQFAKNGTVVKSNTYVGADLASGTEYHEITADIDLVAADYVELKVTLVLAAGSGTFDIVGGTAATFLQAALCAPMTGDFGTFIKADGTTPLTADWAVGSHKLTGLTDPASAQDAATKAYVDSKAAGLVLVEHQTLSGVASADFDAWYSSTYDEYLIEIVNMTLSTGSQPFIRFSTDGGTTFDSSAVYDMQLAYAVSGSAGETHSTGDTKFPLRETTITLSANGSINTSLRFYAPGGSLYKNLNGLHQWNDNSAGLVTARLACVYKNTTAVNAFRLGTSTGTLTAGVRVYGVKKS